MHDMSKQIEPWFFRAGVIGMMSLLALPALKDIVHPDVLRVGDYDFIQFASTATSGVSTTTVGVGEAFTSQLPALPVTTEHG